MISDAQFNQQPNMSAGFSNSSKAWGTPSPHAKGTWTSQDKILTQRQPGLNPVGGGALTGSFAFKNTAFE